MTHLLQRLRAIYYCLSRIKCTLLTPLQDQVGSEKNYCRAGGFLYWRFNSIPTQRWIVDRLAGICLPDCHQSTSHQLSSDYNSRMLWCKCSWCPHSFLSVHEKWRGYGEVTHFCRPSGGGGKCSMRSHSRFWPHNYYGNFHLKSL